ncbi:MAG TPA: hypothetical protein VMI12_16270 [Puia sp.]|nr:hypothetical protein [Puia sp.]
MLRTGNILVDFFSQIIIFFPLIPVIIILFRGLYQKDALTFLLIICLLNFSQNLTLAILSTDYVNEASIRNIFSLLEFILIVQIFKPAVRKRFKEPVDIIMIAILSSLITYYFLKGADQKVIFLDLLKNGFVILLISYCLVNVVKTENLQIFYSPLFWVATGTLFCFVTAILVYIVDDYHLHPSIMADKLLLLNIASVARYFFYALAGLLYNKSIK